MGDSNKNEEHVNGFRKLRSRLVWHMLSFPIFLKIMGLGFLTAILFGSVTLLQTRVGTSRILSQIQTQKVLSTTKLLVNIIEKSVSDGDTASIKQSLEQIRAIYPEIRYVIVRYPDGRVMTSTPEGGIPQDILNIPGTSCPPDCETRISLGTPALYRNRSLPGPAAYEHPYTPAPPSRGIGQPDPQGELRYPGRYLLQR
ncbi:MAG: hypothetical protein P8Y80_14945 [Acidobacteriota bacterium]